MPLTFGVLALFAIAMIGVGLLVTRYSRWPVAVQSSAPAVRAGGTAFIVMSVLVFAAVALVLLWGWGIMALPQ